MGATAEVLGTNSLSSFDLQDPKVNSAAILSNPINLSEAELRSNQFNLQLGQIQSAIIKLVPEIGKSVSTEFQFDQSQIAHNRHKGISKIEVWQDGQGYYAKMDNIPCLYASGSYTLMLECNKRGEPVVVHLLHDARILNEHDLKSIFLKEKIEGHPLSGPNRSDFVQGVVAEIVGAISAISNRIDQQPPLTILDANFAPLLPTEIRNAEEKSDAVTAAGFFAMLENAKETQMLCTRIQKINDQIVGAVGSGHSTPGMPKVIELGGSNIFKGICFTGTSRYDSLEALAQNHRALNLGTIESKPLVFSPGYDKYDLLLLTEKGFRLTSAVRKEKSSSFYRSPFSTMQIAVRNPIFGKEKSFYQNLRTPFSTLREVAKDDNPNSFNISDYDHVLRGNRIRPFNFPKDMCAVICNMKLLAVGVALGNPGKNKILSEPFIREWVDLFFSRSDILGAKIDALSAGTK